jgi:hypothetical protein
MTTKDKDPIRQQPHHYYQDCPENVPSQEKVAFLVSRKLRHTLSSTAVHQGCRRHTYTCPTHLGTHGWLPCTKRVIHARLLMGVQHTCSYWVIHTRNMLRPARQSAEARPETDNINIRIRRPSTTNPEPLTREPPAQRSWGAGSRAEQWDGNMFVEVTRIPSILANITENILFCVLCQDGY